MSLRLLLVGLAAAVAACGSEPPPPANPVEAAPGPEPTTPIEEVMRYIVDPSADVIWDAVVTEVTAAGTINRAPASDSAWLELRRHAVIITEATNLLLMQGRPVGAPGSRSEMPGVDLDPAQIDSLLARDWAAWGAFVVGLRESAGTVLDAIDRRDVEALLVAGDGLDVACENCHAIYWYPGLPGNIRLGS